MVNIFDEVENFFRSINDYITYNFIFLLFLGLFILTIVIVIISTSQSYEAKLIKAIDMFNNYFIDNPQINEDNLVAFNNRMKLRKVPKQLRKQWQQFVLYREKKASDYMSFEACVSTPIKNSTYKRDVTTMNIIAYILALLSFILNIYRAVGDVGMVLQKSLLCPILILVLNYIVTIFLDLRHNAIVSDLNSNYQYFEVNIDKATQTLPEYVDYEVLFDRNEIKRGIPILYAYLQKRAEEEQKELEKARLKNVEHEKFNFDEAGVASSLVLERAMQEAESYMAQRKKLLQDIELINSDITQEEMNFRETTKEYQRQMQVSKETFENFKQQLNEVTSSIQANYLKKQQQQELDRQRNLERDYDTATDRHKKLLDNYQTELKAVEDEITKARQALEKAMMSEFDTYSNKVYKEAYKVVEERESKKTQEMKNQINNLSEQLKEKESELTQVEQQNQDLLNQLNLSPEDYQNYVNQNVNDVSQEVNNESDNNNYQQTDEQYNQQYDNYDQNSQDDAQQYDNYDQNQQYENNDYTDNEQYNDEENAGEYSENSDYYNQTDEESQGENSDINEENVENYDEQPNYQDDYSQPSDDNEQYSDENNQSSENLDESANEENINLNSDDSSSYEQEQPQTLDDEIDNDENSGFDEIEDINVDSKDVFNIVDKPRKKAGRPRKQTNENVSKKSVGRPKKVTNESAVEADETKVSKRGRPKKESVETEVVSESKKSRGRPKKQIGEVQNSVKNETAKQEKTSKSGRPKKEGVKSETSDDENTQNQVKRRGRPKKDDSTSDNPNAQSENTQTNQKKGRGRPKKVDITKVEGNIDDLDAYLDEINNQIAKESAKMEDAKKKLEKKSKISKKN